METQEDEYYIDQFETIIANNDRHKVTFSNEKLRQVVNTMVEETEGEERDAKHNTNNVATDTFIQSPITTNTRKRKTDIPNEKHIYLDSLIETTKGFNILKLQ